MATSVKDLFNNLKQRYAAVERDRGNQKAADRVIEGEDRIVAAPCRSMEDVLGKLLTLEKMSEHPAASPNAKLLRQAIDFIENDFLAPTAPKPKTPRRRPAGITMG